MVRYLKLEPHPTCDGREGRHRWLRFPDIGLEPVCLGCEDDERRFRTTEEEVNSILMEVPTT